MIEFLYNAIKCIAGEDINIAAEITDAMDNPITSGCSVVFIDKDFSTIGEHDGVYSDGAWTFTIPAEVTKGMEGRYWYRIKLKDESLSCAAPIYMEV